MSVLRRRLGQDAPLGEPPPISLIDPPPARVFADASTRRTGFAAEAARHTTALLGIGHVGCRYATDVVLQFQAELAVAHEAVAALLPDDWPAQQGLLELRSRATDHQQFLLRPDLGRRLDEPSLERLRDSARRNVDVQPILADGLSAVATQGSGPALLSHFMRACEDLGLSVGMPVCARFARVWLEDEIGETVGARVAAILLGERPGLGTGDGLSAYLVFDPRVGRTDGDRNMMSNIHARGTPPEQAALQLAALAAGMLEQGTSGVGLDLSRLRGPVGHALDRKPRAPQPRTRLVSVEPRRPGQVSP